MQASIIIPCYNAEPHLAQAIGSALEQSRPAEEVILVDDGSTDRSLKIANRFSDAIRIVSGPNCGAPHARNLGASLASGDVLLFLDADDVLGPGLLEALTGALFGTPGQIAVAPWYRLEKHGEHWVRRPPSCRPRRPEHDDLQAWLSRWYHPPCSVLWSRTAFQKTGGWDERVRVNQDGDIMMRAFVEGVSLVRTSRGVAYYRRAPEDEDSLSNRHNTREGIESEIYVLAKVAYMLEKRDLIARYRVDVSQAFDDLAGACLNKYPELFNQCKEYARRYDKPRVVRAARRRVRFGMKQVKECLHSNGQHVAEEGLDDEPVSEYGEEIRYGLDAAQAATHPVCDDEASAAITFRLQRKHPHVSVVIPTYNRAERLARALDSVFAQTFSDLEVIVIDDGSTDHTEEVIGDYTARGVRYIRQPENRGVATARNCGMRAARGSYIAFLDSDDEWFPSKLERQIDRFDKLPEEIGLMYCGAEIVEDDGTVSYFHPEHRGKTFNDLLVGNVIHASSGVVIRRNVIRTAGFFDESMPAIEDYDYWLRIARFNEFDFMKPPLFRYFHHQSSVRKTSEVQNNLDAYECFFQKHRHDMQRAGVTHLFLKESAQRHLIAGRSDKKGVRPLAWRALYWQPFAPEAFRFLLQTTLPDRHFQTLRHMYQSARSKVPGTS